MSAAIDQTVTPVPSQGSSAQGAPAANTDLGSFIASIGAVSGALTELLGVVNYNSSKISEFSAEMDQGTMSFYEATQTQAAQNLENAFQTAKHQKWWHMGFKAAVQSITKGPLFILSEGVNKAFPNSKIAHRVMTAVMLVAQPYAELKRVLPHELAKVLPEAVNNAYEKANNIMNYPADHAKQYLQTAETELVKGVAYPFYEAIKAIDPSMSDEMAHMIADAISTVVIMVVLFVAVTVISGGAADAFLAEESAAVIEEEVGTALGQVAEDGFGMEIEAAFTDEGAAVSEDAAAASEDGAAVNTGAAAQTPADVNSRIDSQRLQGQIRQLNQAMQKMRYLQAILGLIKGVEELGNGYFDARMAITTRNMGQIQANLKSAQSDLEQVSQINQLNFNNLKQTMEECLADIRALYNGLAAFGASMAQMYR